MRPWMATGVSIAFIAAWGCGGTKVGSTHDPLVVFPAEATWAWDEADNRLPNAEIVRTLDLDSVIREAATAAFAERGYVEASSGAPAQYLLSYDVGLGEVITQTSSRAVGSVSLHLVEARTGHRVWVGFVRTDVDVSRTDAERRSWMRERMRTMLKDFPPGHSSR